MAITASIQALLSALGAIAVSMVVSIFSLARPIGSMSLQGLYSNCYSTFTGVFLVMLHRLHWKSWRFLRHGLLAAGVTAAIAIATPAQAELPENAIGQRFEEAAAVQAAEPESKIPAAITEAAVTEAANTEAANTEVSATPLDLAPLELAPPPEAPKLLDQMPIDAESRVANRRLVINLEQRRVYVYEGETTLVSYPIAVGRAGWETPKGEFEIFQMIKDPSWQHPWNGSIVPPGPDNPLGRRWIGFWTDGVNAIGFHGTPNESLVGQAVSHGCIRMKNKDVANLYAMVGDGTTVTVE